MMKVPFVWSNIKLILKPHVLLIKHIIQVSKDVLMLLFVKYMSYIRF